MKIRNLELLMGLLAGILGAGPAHAGEGTERNFLARYDFQLREGTVTSTFKSQAFLTEAEKITFEYPPHFVELSLQPVSDSEYSLKMTVAPTGDDPRRVRLDRTFRGRYGFPVALKVEDGPIQVLGTLAVLRSK